MNILVTGGAGFVGSHIVDILIENNHQVTVVDSLITGKKENINPQAKFYQIDIRSNELENIFQQETPEIVYHLAAQAIVPPSIEDPLNDQDVNIGGTINILELMRKYQAKKIIYSSSAAIYGNPVSLPVKEEHPIQPISPYGLSKSAAEQYIKLYFRMYGIDYTILRYANIYGPRQTSDGEGGVISIFIDKLKNNQPLTINGDGRHTRDYIYVGDVAKANLKALQHGSRAVVNISTGIAVSLNELVETLTRAVDEDVEVFYGEKRKGDIVHSSLDPSLSSIFLKWEYEKSLAEGLQITFNTNKKT